MAQTNSSTSQMGLAGDLSNAQSPDPAQLATELIEQQLQAVIRHARYAMEGLPHQNLRYRDLVKVLSAAEQAILLNRQAASADECCALESSSQHVDILIEHVAELSTEVSTSRADNVLLPLLHDHSV